MKERKEWRPLPDSITVKDSKIEGLGVFATQNIPANTSCRILADRSWGIQGNTFWGIPGGACLAPVPSVAMRLPRCVPTPCRF